MILLLVFIGFIAGATAALNVLAGRAGLIAALISYGLFAAGAVGITALLVCVVPLWRAQPEPAPRPQVPPMRRQTG